MNANQVIVFPVTDQAIVALGAKLKGLVVPFGDKAAYKTLSSAIAEVRTVRTEVEKKRVELKADALELGRRVDNEAKRITALLVAIENPLKEQKEKIDAEDARIKAEKEAVERERIEAIQKRINHITTAPMRANMKSIAEIEKAIQGLKDFEIDESFAEFVGQASKEKFLALHELEKYLEVRKLFEAEEAERITREQAEAEARRVESERLKAEAEALRIEREKFTEEQRKIAEANRIEHELQLAEQAKQHAIILEQQRAIDAENKRLASEAAERQRQQDLAKARKEAAEKAISDEAEKQRIIAEAKAREDALKPDIERIKAHIDNFLATMPEMTTQDGKKMANELFNVVECLVESYW